MSARSGLRSRLLALTCALFALGVPALVEAGDVVHALDAMAEDAPGAAGEDAPAVTEPPRREVGVDAPPQATTRRQALPSRRYRRTPVNVGLFPYTDVNAYRQPAVNHVSANMLVGRTYAVRGVTASGVADIVVDDVHGVQGGGFYAQAREIRGAQWSGFASVAKGKVRGFQGSHGLALALKDTTGVQSGFVSVTKGKVRGAQFGLINVADEVDGATIGLINVVKRGGHHTLDTWSSDTSMLNVGTKLGSKWTYSMLGVGMTRGREDFFWMPTVGFGLSAPYPKRWFFNTELLASWVVEGTDFAGGNVLSQLRLVAGYRIKDKFAVYGGPTASVMAYDEDRRTRLSDVSFLAPVQRWDTGRDTGVDLGVGFVLGIQLF